MKEFLKVARALREPNRIKILKILQHGEFCVCEIQAAIGITQGSISKNLGILNEAGLVECRRKGLWAYYRLAGSPRSAYAGTLLGNLRHWLENDAEVSEMIKNLPDIRRKNLCGTR